MIFKIFCCCLEGGELKIFNKNPILRPIILNVFERQIEWCVYNFLRLPITLHEMDVFLIPCCLTMTGCHF